MGDQGGVLHDPRVYQRAERDHVSPGVPDVILRQVLNIAPVFRVGLGHHVEIPAVDREIVHIPAAEIRLERAEHVGDRESELLALLPVDVHLVARGPRREEREDPAQLRPLVRLRDERADHVFELLDVVGRFMLLELERKPSRRPQARDRGGGYDDDVGVPDGGEPPLQRGDEPVELERFVRPLVPRLELHENRAAVRFRRKRHHVQPPQRGVMPDAGGLLQHHHHRVQDFQAPRRR